MTVFSLLFYSKLFLVILTYLKYVWKNCGNKENKHNEI